MKLKEIVILLPVDSLEDLPLDQEPSASQSLLAAWTVPFHPAIIVAAGKTAEWQPVERFVADGQFAESLVLLREIADLVRGMPHPVAIEGHTDATPAGVGRFESNWNLSAARAVSALRFLVEVGGIEASRFRATGFADTRPLSPNYSPEERALNRRVEIVFLRTPHEATGSARAEISEALSGAAPDAAGSEEAVESGGVIE